MDHWAVPSCKLSFLHFFTTQQKLRKYLSLKQSPESPHFPFCFRLITPPLLAVLQYMQTIQCMLNFTRKVKKVLGRQSTKPNHKTTSKCWFNLSVSLVDWIMCYQELWSDTALDLWSLNNLCPQPLWTLLQPHHTALAAFFLSSAFYFFPNVWIQLHYHFSFLL